MRRQRYNISNIKRALQNPRIFVDEFDQVCRTWAARRLYDGENFVQKDWDNLVILDACRFDFFSEYNPFDGELSQTTSLGASSGEFFFNNFVGEQYHDTVYVTGNTRVETIRDGSLHRVVKTYADIDSPQKGWLPQTTLDAALDAYEEHPDKRIVVHFMQPHTPYLGDYAGELRQRVADKYGIEFTYSGSMQEEGTVADGTNLLYAFKRGYISGDELRRAYGENLRLVFEYVEELLENIEGKTVITADHSESLGDFSELSRPIYGHKEYALSRGLRQVPWLVIDRDRRETFSEAPINPTTVDEDVLQENLRDLGYL